MLVVPAANSDWTHLGGTGPQPVLVHSSQAACGLILTHGHRFANLTLLCLTLESKGCHVSRYLNASKVWSTFHPTIVWSSCHPYRRVFLNKSTLQNIGFNTVLYALVKQVTHVASWN